MNMGTSINDKTFRRLLISTEKLVEDKSSDHWKINQFVNTLTDMQKTMNRSSSRQRDDYKQRIEKLRQYIDLSKLEDQTFPRSIQSNPVRHEQPSETIVSPPSLSPSTEVDKPLQTSAKPERSHLNRQQNLIQNEEDKQDDFATSMISTTKSIKNSAQMIHDIVAGDRKKIATAEHLIDTNTSKLSVQSRRLKHNAYSASNCWIYLMLLLVIITFIYLTLFMRMFRKRIVTVSSSTSKSRLFNNVINQTTNNSSNITTTKSTDYISVLLNYANENHTDL